jgi:hypothetical protein
LVSNRLTATDCLPKVELAEETPEVDTIQVDMLGTVNILMAPMIKVMITVPNENKPLLAKLNNAAILSPPGV